MLTTLPGCRMKSQDLISIFAHASIKQKELQVCRDCRSCAEASPSAVVLQHQTPRLFWVVLDFVAVCRLGSKIVECPAVERSQH